MIIFQKLRYKNFLSTGNIFTEIDFLQHRSVLVVGKNGAGKSTLIDALSFGLFNKAFRNINKPQLVNEILKKDCLVEVEFETNNKQYKVIRGVNPDIFEIFENGVKLNQESDVRDYQNFFEKYILKFNHKTFCQIVILGKANYVPFMELEKSARRDVIENIIGLLIFTKMNTLLKSRLQEIDQELKSIRKDKDHLKQKIELIKEHQTEMSSSNEKYIKEKKARIKKATTEVTDFESEIAEITKAIRSLESVITSKNKSQVKSQFNKLTEFYIKIDNKIKRLVNESDFFKTNKNCPTCKQEIDDQFREDMIKQKEQLLDESREVGSKCSEKKKEAAEKIKEIEEIEDDLVDLELKKKEFLSRIQNSHKYIKELQSEIKTLQEDDKKEVKTENLQKLGDEYQELVKQEIDLNTKKKLHDYAGILLKDSGIKAKIIKQYIPVINKLINKYLAMFDLFVRFEMNEQFEEKLLARHLSNYSYESFSEGEKVRINLAILFTWRAVAKLRNSVSTNLLILDEVFDGSLDLDGVDEFLKIINHLVNEENNVMVISHKVDQLYDKFEHVLKFEKNKNFSRRVE